MAGIKVGDIVDTLICGKELPDGKVVMKCRSCGYTGIFDKYNTAKAKTPCRKCRYMGKYRTGYAENRNIVKGWKFDREVPVTEDNEFANISIAFTCKDCGESFYILKSEIDGEVKCTKCRNEVKKQVKIETDEGGKLKDTEIINRSTGSVSKIVEDTDSSLVGKIIGNFEILSVIKERTQKNESKPLAKLKCKCKICGIIDIYDRSKIRKCEAVCKACSKLNTKMYKGKNGIVTDYTGTVINGLKLTRQGTNSEGIMMGEFKCIYCGEERKAPISLWLNKQIFCLPCMRMPRYIKAVCECGAPYNVLYKDLYTGEASKKCTQCKDIINFKVEGALRDDRGTFKNVLNKFLNKGLGLQSIEDSSRLAIFGEAFINRDGEKAYNCFCVEHRQELILTREEINEFKHKQCSCEEAEFYKMINIPTKIKKSDNKRAIENI